MRTDRMHPLPWTHWTKGKKMSAVTDAEGNVVCGSLICECSDGTRARQTHAYIVQAAEAYAADASKRRADKDTPIIHICPPKGSDSMPCCGRDVGELLGDRITASSHNVTCPGRKIV